MVNLKSTEIPQKDFLASKNVLMKMSYVNNVSCDKCGKYVNERSMEMIKHKEETFFLCLSCRDYESEIDKYAIQVAIDKESQ